MQQVVQQQQQPPPPPPPPPPAQTLTQDVVKQRLEVYVGKVKEDRVIPEGPGVPPPQVQDVKVRHPEETFPVKRVGPDRKVSVEGLPQAQVWPDTELMMLQKMDAFAWRTVPSENVRLLLVVLNEYPVEAEVDLNFFHGLFSQFGVVERISTFTKDNRRQLLVQYSHTHEASTAMSYLSSRTLNIQGRNTYLVVIPSHQEKLKFRDPNEKNQDFSSANLWMAQNGWAPDQPFEFLWGVWRRGRGVLVPQQLSEFQFKQIPAGANGGVPIGEVGRVLHVSGLAGDSGVWKKDGVVMKGPKRDIGIDLLWRVAGQYGQLVSARLLVANSECALVEFASKDEALRVKKYLNHIVVFGRMLNVKESVQPNASHWSGHTTELTERLRSVHQNATPTPAPEDRMARPSQKIAIWGVPPTDSFTQQEIVTQALLNHRHRYVSIAEERLQAGTLVIVSFATTDQAFAAMGELNGVPITDVLPSTFAMYMHFVKCRSKKKNAPGGGGGVATVQQQLTQQRFDVPVLSQVP